jgi:broad specificity phosphatase PhoE
MKEVWFIRHAQSEANAGLSTSIPGNIPLTSYGREQAQALSDLITFAPHLFVVSPYIRTQQTAEPVLRKFPNVPLEIWPIHEYDFLSPIQCADRTVEQRKPWVKNYWDQCEVSYVHGEGAESFALFKNRVLECVKRLENSEHEFIIVFAHGHVMRAIWQYFITKNTVIDNDCMRYFRDKMKYLPVSNTGIFKASYNLQNWNIISPMFNPEINGGDPRSGV